MSVGKVEFALGALTFSGEGEQDWVAQQLDKVLAVAPSLTHVQQAIPASNSEGGASESDSFTKTLASYIKEKKGEANQVQRFLATADWLRRRRQPLTTGAVAKALRDNQQKKLANPSECLNKNVGKGYCEKSGDGFFITPEGLSHLGSS